MWPAVRRNTTVRSEELQTLLDVLTGVVSAGDRVQLIQYNNSSNYALDVRNLDTTNSYGLRVRDASSNNLLLVYKDNITVGANVTVGASLTVDGLDLSAHTHTGAAGHGVQVAHTSLTDIGTNTHAQIDTHIAATSAHGASSNPGAAAAMLTTDASGLLQLVGLGIGTAPATGFLDVLGTTHGIRGKGGNAGSWGGLFYDSASAKSVLLGGGTYAAVIDGGNVGIGEAAPASYPLHVRKDQNANTAIQVLNNTAGVSAQAQLRAVNDGGMVTIVGRYSSLSTATGALVANAGFLYSSGAAPLVIMAAHAAADIVLASGGTAAKAQLYASGGLHLGATPADPGANNVKVEGNLRVGNTNYWTLAGWTTNADAAVNGYVTVTIDGTTRKLATIA